MSQDQQNSNGTGRKIVRNTGRVVTAPVRAVWQTLKLGGGQYAKTAREGKKSLSSASDQIRQNWETANRSGANHQFNEIFSGPEGEHLRQQNIKRFLQQKRVNIAMIFAFLTYGSWYLPVGGLTVLAALFIGTAFAFEAQFRLWQLRNKRLSIEEQGRITDWWREESILEIYNPELWRVMKKIGGRRNGS